MCCKRLLGIAALFLMLGVPALYGEGRIVVDESRMRIDIGTRATLQLPVTNRTSQTISASIQLEFLNTGNRSVLSLTSPVVIGAGSKNLEIPLPGFLELKEAAEARYGWLRLRYTVPGEVSDIASVSRLAREPFVLTLISSAFPATVSGKYIAQVFAVDPSTGAPVANVRVSGRLALESNAGPAINTRTDPSGYAYLSFDPLPANSVGLEPNLEITANIGGFVRRIVSPLHQWNRVDLTATTDKPLYQPGQKLRVRLLAMDHGRSAAQGTPLSVKISGPGGDVFETELVASAFGEAHAEWAIPDNARSGQYLIEAGHAGSLRARASVWISPYELPSFAVETQRDRAYYLPGQNAEIDVRTRYLFGKPVPGARVRIVREIQREWNSRERKWEIREGPSIEGTTDHEGRFHATLNLEEEMDGLSDEGPSFDDLDWTAFVTDASTGRTEQRRFTTRITHHPIHLYVLGHFQAPGRPLDFYVTAAYADGSPAPCDVDILDARSDGSVAVLGTVRVNKYGIAKVAGLKTPTTISENDWFRLTLRGTDAMGRTGETSWRSYRNSDLPRVYTDKVFYAPDEAIQVRIESPKPAGRIILNALSDAGVVYSAVLPVLNGQASARIPYSPAMKGEVQVVAMDPSDYNRLQDTRLVLYPGMGRLEIEAVPGKSAYAPGEEATLTFRMRNPDGSSQAGLLGVTVLDKAVEERASSSEFARYVSWGPHVNEARLPGISREELFRLDHTKPIDPELELAAEALLRHSPPRFWLDVTGGAFDSANVAVLKIDLHNQLEQLRNSGGQYPSGRVMPTDEASLRAMVRKLDPEFDTRRDPWNRPYRLKSSVTGSSSRIEILSTGPDKQYGGADDFSVASLYWNNFEGYAALIDAAIERHHQRTGRHIRSIETLKEELRLAGEDFDAWRDPEGARYSTGFRIDGPRFAITIRANQQDVWTHHVFHTAELEQHVGGMLGPLIQQKKTLQEIEESLKLALADNNAGENLRDPWGHQYRVTVNTDNGFSDSVTVVHSLAALNDFSSPRNRWVIRVRSAGPDGREFTEDDFAAVTIIRASEESSADPGPRGNGPPETNNASGALVGTLIDESGALLPGVTIKITSSGGVSRSMLTNDAGAFSFASLRPGDYRVRAEFTGFNGKTLIVPIRAGAYTRVVAVLEIGAVEQYVTVNAVAAERQFSTQAPPEPISTPRLRDEFPETLLWQPALETRRDGTAQVRFKLADNITTWKARVIASTRDGRLTFAETEFTAFQPFFLEHDPPHFLTEGDKIALPVVVRNYLDRNQSVEVSMKPEAWFTPLDATTKHLEVAAGAAKPEVFAFEARTPVNNGKQQIVARGSEASDAIEKTSTVRPLGREMSYVSSEILRASTTHNLTIPSDVIAGTTRAELKVYPNLTAHIVDAIEGIMRRPYGCAEQVTSSAYPSLLFLRVHRRTRENPNTESSKAMAYLRIAGQMLRGYQTEEGGFSYWTHGEADAAVTAYALQFLSEAKEFIPVDDALLSNAAAWLARKQLPDGSWGGNLAATAFIARTLTAPGLPQTSKASVPAALAYLQKRMLETPSPYVLASIMLAANNTGDSKLAAAAYETLKAGAKAEGDMVYWDQLTNTPFHSWGHPGRVEATATVVGALAAARGEPALIDKGLLFLLKSKDAYGVWHSTQATVRVLDALSGLITEHREGAGAADVLVNGVKVTAVRFGEASGQNKVMLLDISKFLVPGGNRVEVIATKRMPWALVHLTENHYVPWDPSAPDLVSGPLRFSVLFDKVESPIGETIHARVTAERTESRGSGMMLGEIGLPPGADVDRASLDRAMAIPGAALTRYDILPDRVIVYLWPHAADSTFEFTFRLRYGIEARTPASQLYDYYNPDARVIVPPTRFVAR